ncbi:MAG: UDP-N-acetylmuramoyl-L-alanyl-D-glutamate--2,6-diaminopimelate ligase, partial [Nevskiales bacterium]
MNMTDIARPPQRLSALLAGLAPVAPDQDVEIRGLDTDSRRLRAGGLFMACRSFSGGAHGLAHLEQARALGAAAILWEPATGISAPVVSAVPSLAIKNLSHHAGAIAGRFYGEPSARLFVVGITGTDGKTSTAHILAQALARLGGRCGYLGTLGYGFLPELDTATHTTPDGVMLQRWLAWLAQQGADSVMMEVSSHALDQGRANGVAFELAVLTNISRDHLDYHGEQQHYIAAKRQLFSVKGLRAAILNQDDVHGSQWLNELPAGVAGVTYGLANAAAAGASRYVLGAEPEPHERGLRLAVRTSWGSGVLESKLLGRFNAYNLLAALAVLLEKDIPLSDALAALREVDTVPGRMQAIRVKDRQPLVAVDYAHTPEALGQALRAMRAHCRGELTVVFGCGGDRDRGKRPLMAAAAVEYADCLIITDDNPRSEDPQAIMRDILAGLPAGTRITVEHDRARAIAQALAGAGPRDAVLVAGKGHEDYQIYGRERR